MFNVYDKTTKRYISTMGWVYKSNADVVAHTKNIKECGLEELDKLEYERRYVVKEMK